MLKRLIFYPLWIMLLAFLFMSQDAKGEMITVHECEPQFDSLLSNTPEPVITEDFATGPGSLSVSTSDPTRPVAFTVGKALAAPDGNLFYGVAFSGPDTFTGFGIQFEGVGPGIFSVFIDGNLEYLRTDDNLTDFFIGATGMFDLFVISANVGPYAIDNARYTLVPEPASVAMLGLGLLFILPPVWRNRWTGHS